MYASISDINAHLPDDKVQATEVTSGQLLIDAERLVRARITGVFSTDILASWTNFDSTPEEIRRITSLIVAARFYAMLSAEDDSDGSEYAQYLYDMAIAELNQIRDGLLTVTDPSTGEELTNDNATESSFWPNDTTDGPSFTIADTWA